MEKEILNKRQCFLCKKIIKPLFILPQDINRLSIWLKIIRKEHLLQSMSPAYIRNNARLCALHFNDSYFTSTLKTRLHRFAVPHHIENRNQESPNESLNFNSDNSESISELNCRQVEKNNFSSSQVEGNSVSFEPISLTMDPMESAMDPMESTMDPISLNQVSEKDPFTKNVSSSQSDATLLNKVSETKSFTALVSSSPCSEILENKVSEKDPFTPNVSSSQSDATLLNKVSEMKSFTTLVSSSPCSETLENKVSENSFITTMSLSQSDGTSLNNSDKNLITTTTSSPKTTLLNEVSDKALQKNKTMTNLTSPDSVKDSSVTVVTLCCTESEEGIAFHKLLQDPKQRKRWISATKSDRGNPSHISVLCPKHIQFNEDSVANCPSALKENTMPNTTALDQKKDVGLFNMLGYQWKKAVPTDHQKVTTNEGISELHGNPKEVKKVYVKVMWNESVCKITKRKHSGTLTNDVDSKKKIKRDNICSPNDISPDDFQNTLMDLPLKACKDLVNHVESNKTLPSVPSQQNNGEEPVDNVILLSDSRNNKQIHPVSSLGRKVQSLSDSSTQTLSAEEIKQNGYCDIMEEKKNLIDSSTQTIPEEEIKQDDSYNTIVRKTINPVNSHSDNLTEKNDLIDSSAQTIKREEISKNGCYSSIVGNIVGPKNSDTVGNIIERKDLIDSSTQNVPVEEIIQSDSSDAVREVDANISHFDTVTEERTSPTYFPKITNVVGGINPLNLQEIAKMEDPQSYNCCTVIKAPNEWWGITRTPKCIICTKWDEFYDPIFKVIIENDFNVKIFIKGHECVKESKKVPLENISTLLKEVDSYQICAGINDKSMTDCMGHLESESGQPFSLWCKGCQRKGKELMNRYKLQQELG